MVLRLRAAAAGVQNLGSHLDFRKTGVRIPNMKVMYRMEASDRKVKRRTILLSLAPEFNPLTCGLSEIMCDESETQWLTEARKDRRDRLSERTIIYP